MYFKGLPEISYGATLMALQWQGNEAANMMFAAILSLIRLGDGLIVWLHGGDKLRYRAAGHWITGAGFIGWVTRRLRYSGYLGKMRGMRRLLQGRVYYWTAHLCMAAYNCIM